MPILDQHGRPIATGAPPRGATPRRVAARYDAAALSDATARHWAQADLLSGDAAASPGVRARIRSRARYECYESNSFANGVIKLLAYYLIGAGPRLKLLGVDRTLNRQVQAAWRSWAKATRLAAKLRTMRMAKAVDGEGIAILTTNPGLRHPVQLDLQLREADQMATPHLSASERHRIDGIDFDPYGNPVRYHFLRDHPGADYTGANPFETDEVAAEHVIHWFRADRPGTRRGVSEIAPALPLFALVRRYVLAVLGAAETAAENANVMYTDSPALDSVADVAPLDVFELEMRSMLTLPAGWKLAQVKAEQPTTTFGQFRDALWNEIARCVLMPFNIAAGNSAGYNFASGRLDHQAFDLAIDTEREDCVCEVLDRVFEAWLREYLSVQSGIAPSDIDTSLYQHAWYWPPKEHVDPQKQAGAVQTLWNMGLLSDEDYWFSHGVDPDDQEEALARQQERRRRLGLPTPSGSAGSPPAGAEDPAAGEEDDDLGEETPADTIDVEAHA